MNCEYFKESSNSSSKLTEFNDGTSNELDTFGYYSLPFVLESKDEDELDIFKVGLLLITL